MPTTNTCDSPSVFDPNRPITPELLDLFPLRRWPSQPIARQHFLKVGFCFLLAHGRVLEASHLETLVRSAWRSARLLLQANPELSLLQLRDHVENFLLAATSSSATSSDSATGLPS